MSCPRTQYYGCVHTWCPSTSTWAPAQNGAVFRHWAPDISLPSSVPEYKVETLYSGMGTVPEFWRGYLKKWCVHISAHQESFSGTKSEHSLCSRPGLQSGPLVPETSALTMRPPRHHYFHHYFYAFICRSCVWLSAIEKEEKINCHYQ